MRAPGSIPTLDPDVQRVYVLGQKLCLELSERVFHTTCTALLTRCGD